MLKFPNKYTRLFVYRNKLIHFYDDENDFDMVRCKNTQQAVKLYDTIEARIDKKKYPNIFFMGKLSSTTSVEWAISEIEKKTGWTRNKCKAL